MKVSTCKLDGILIIEPDVFDDNRGFFLESYNKKKYKDIGISVEFVQDNHSASTKGTLRGLHYQLNPGQSKLVRATSGEVVDVRRKSPTFGQWESFILTAKNKKQVFIPRGFAHGFCVLSDYAEFLYKCDEYYSPKDERGFLWNDPKININWPISNPVFSKRDLSHHLFKKLTKSDLF